MIPVFKHYRFVFLLSWCVAALTAGPAYGNGRIYSIHIHTVDSAMQAEKQVADLNRRGYDAFYRHMPSFEKGIQYRVFVGKYASKPEAVQAINKLWNSDLSNQYAITVLKDRTASPSRKTQHQAKATETAVKKNAAAEKPESAALLPTPKSPAISFPEKPQKENPAKLLGDALACYFAGQYEKSLSLLNDLSESIENKDILFWKALCEAKLDRTRDAVETMNLFLAGAPGSPQGMLELAVILYKQGEKKKVLALLEKAEAFQPPAEMADHMKQIRNALKEPAEEGFWSTFDFLVKDKKPLPAAKKTEPEHRNAKPPGRFYQIGSESETLLRKAQQIAPDNEAVAYYLGFLDIRKNRLDDAIHQWETYLSTAPENPRTIHLQKQMMMLYFRHAAVASIRALQSNREIIPSRTDNSIVITDFRNRCYSVLPGMEQGTAAMLTDDLRKVDGIHVTNRILTQSMFRSMRADLAPALDSYRAGMLGRKLASRFIVWGEFTDISENAFQFTVTVTDSRNFTNIGMAEIKGTRDEFYLLEKRLVYWILETIGIHRKDLPPETILAMEQPHSRRFEAFLSYARGMAYLDTQQFQKAAMAFQNAMQLDSSFVLARKAFQSTPDDIYYCPFFEQSGIIVAVRPENGPT